MSEGINLGGQLSGDFKRPRGVFTTINGKPIRWEDQPGVVHSCEGADVHPSVRLIWTLCEIDVPANKAFLDYGATAATCKKCNEAMP